MATKGSKRVKPEAAGRLVFADDSSAVLKLRRACATVVRSGALTLVAQAKLLACRSLVALRNFGIGVPKQKLTTLPMVVCTVSGSVSGWGNQKIVPVVAQEYPPARSS